MAGKPSPAILDLGPVVGSNVSFFGEELGCRLRVEDVIADIEAHAAAGTTDQLPAFFRTRFKSEPGSVDGVLCWDVFDYLEKDAATALADAPIVAESKTKLWTEANDAERPLLVGKIPRDHREQVFGADVLVYSIPRGERAGVWLARAAPVADAME